MDAVQPHDLTTLPLSWSSLRPTRHSLLAFLAHASEILLRYDIKKPIVAPTVQRHGATAGLGKSAKQPLFQGRSCWFLEAHNLYAELVPLNTV
ncbi:uncharacterized protein UHOD_11986 [Ustilago sp. UG-2017b]|nr:uncharacterized protein UHOD_11986 [Ustilago sp. UG-2017b]